jgi:hypothetical protein
MFIMVSKSTNHLQLKISQNYHLIQRDWQGRDIDIILLV